MATRRSAETTPDLFSAAPTTKALERRPVPEGKAQPNRSTSQSNYFLPKDLPGALKRLDNLEIDALLAAVTNEAERRGRLPPSPAKEKPTIDAKSQPRQAPAGDGAGSLTPGKLNAMAKQGIPGSLASA